MKSIKILIMIFLAYVLSKNIKIQNSKKNLKSWNKINLDKKNRSWIRCLKSTRSTINSFTEMILNIWISPKHYYDTYLHYFLESLSQTSMKCFKKEWYFNNNKCVDSSINNLNFFIKLYDNFILKKEIPGVLDLLDSLKVIYNLNVCFN